MAATTSTQCALLDKLPGELRNRIYCSVLISLGNICIHDGNYEQPALLRTCTMIRKEASEIYYGENKFVLKVRDILPHLDPSNISSTGSATIAGQWNRSGFRCDLGALVLLLIRIPVGTMLQQHRRDLMVPSRPSTQNPPGGEYDVQGLGSWDDLLVWLRRAYHNGVPPFTSRPGAGESFDRNTRVAVQLAEFFEVMGWHRGSSWKRTKAALEVKKKIVKLGRRGLPWAA